MKTLCSVAKATASGRPSVWDFVEVDGRYLALRRDGRKAHARPSVEELRALYSSFVNRFGFTRIEAGSTPVAPAAPAPVAVEAPVVDAFVEVPVVSTEDAGL